MATKLVAALLVLSVLFSVHCDVFDRILDDVTPCRKTCDNTFSPHTFETNLAGCCDRGCRLFSMVEFIYDDMNKTLEVCMSSCTEAYSDKDELAACNLGCKSQKPFAIQQQEDDLLSEQNIHLVDPLMYIHNLYSNFLSSAKEASVSWSVYMQGSDGKVIVIRSEPSYSLSEFPFDVIDADDEYKTSNYIETNLIPIDNAATPVLRNSQLKSLRSDDDILDLSVRDLDGHNSDFAESDWLSCVSKKTVLPRLILSLLLLMCAIALVWLCLSAAVTAPDHKITVHPQKLSINGDEEVINALLAQGIKPSYPQEKSLLMSSLPIRVRVERI